MDTSHSTFISDLIDITASEIEAFSSEIRANTVFHDNFGRNRYVSDGGRRLSWYPGISPVLGEVFYILCRKLKSERVVETGVSGGVSSSYILCALEKNGSGRLYSIDLPWGGRGESGWLIPDYLRHRWELRSGRSSDLLPPLLDELGEIDVFIHDSDHSYRNMSFEFEQAWAHLKSGGILLSHNIDYSDAFRDFCEKVGVQGITLHETGGAVKP